MDISLIIGICLTLIVLGIVLYSIISFLIARKKDKRNRFEKAQETQEYMGASDGTHSLSDTPPDPPNTWGS